MHHLVLPMYSKIPNRSLKPTIMKEKNCSYFYFCGFISTSLVLRQGEEELLVCAQLRPNLGWFFSSAWLSQPMLSLLHHEGIWVNLHLDYIFACILSKMTFWNCVISYETRESSFLWGSGMSSYFENIRVLDVILLVTFENLMYIYTSL